MSNKTNHGLNGLQAQLDAKYEAHKPPAPLAQMRTPAWKEGSPEWCAEIKSRDAAKALLERAQR